MSSKPGAVVTATFVGDLSGQWVASALAAPNSKYDFPTIGYPPDKPPQCRDLVEPSPSTRTAYLCAPLSVVL